ncbi:MAG TPA: hypothetical protein VMD56_08650 [Steroidobacteraceae bacterium]|nr:hypothetical protein [Steroidobacteraceae bacterium]
MRSSQLVSAAAIVLVSGAIAAAQIHDHLAAPPAGAASAASAAATSPAATSPAATSPAATSVDAQGTPARIGIRFAGSSFTVSGWKPPPTAPQGGWSAVFAVYASVAAAPGASPTPVTPGLPALLGSYAIEHGALVFRPRFPLAAGMQYRAVFTPPRAPAISRVFYGPPRDVTPSTRVLHIYPSAAVLPSNTLRLYIYFSAPMSRGEAAAYVHVLDAHGHVLHEVFLPGEELWDPQFTQLTLTFDPGRIKRGLTSNERMGPPIAPGARYTLVIERGWPDARGVPLVAGASKVYRGGPALRTPPDPHQWRVGAPAAGARGPVTVDFPHPMNYPLLQRMLRVTGPHGSVAGSIGIGHDETRWSFTPRRAWPAGRYQLIVDRDLEDVAGNRIDQPFDIDVFQRVTEHIVTRTLAVPFEVR